MKVRTHIDRMVSIQFVRQTIKDCDGEQAMTGQRHEGECQ
jgi:hypothetical protein